MIEHARQTDQGTYECRARNEFGETIATAVELRYLAEDEAEREEEEIDFELQTGDCFYIE